MQTINTTSIRAGADFLAGKFHYFQLVLDKFGYPPLWQREQGFHTLVQIILEQQVSLTSAQAAYEKLSKVIGKPEPESFLALSDAQLLDSGFSRQKKLYCRELATAILSGELDLEQLPFVSDAKVIRQLTAIKGIGPWTANIYLLMALLRPDVWPTGDIALEIGYQKLRGLPDKPDSKQMAEKSLQWQPWRAVAARLIYHYYLRLKNERDE